MTWDQGQVKGLRQKLGLTQSEFADLLGCRQQTISEWEQGLYVPGNAYAQLLNRLAERSHVPPMQVYPHAPKSESGPRRVVARLTPVRPIESREPVASVGPSIQERAPESADLFESPSERPFDPAID
jgi:transcriptional regulator with XRE-family HTH domain